MQLNGWSTVETRAPCGRSSRCCERTEPQVQFDLLTDNPRGHPFNFDHGSDPLR